MSTGLLSAERPAAAPPSRRRWRFPGLQAVAALILLAGTGVFLYPSTAAWLSQYEQSRVVEQAERQLNRPPANDATYRQHELARARAYNDALASGALVAANTNVPTSGGTPEGGYRYQELLSAAGDGVMGRLRYDSLAIDLPIYHGTSDDTLLKGIGHLEGTSLPVGGPGNRSVLTAHRGLATATMFTDLNQAQIGDTFTLEVLGEVLTYRVVDYTVVDPDQTETLRAVPGQDLVTLVTCTPLGINTQRILVTAERVTPTPPTEIEKAGNPPDIPGFPWWAVLLGVTLVGTVGYVWWSGYPARPRPRRVASDRRRRSVPPIGD